LPRDHFEQPTLRRGSQPLGPRQDSRGIEWRLSRGYRGRLTGPVLVDASRHSFAEVGDEALLLARSLPCWAARDRAAGIRAACAAGAEAVVLDDGFQNPTVAKTLSLLVVDTTYRFGNGRVIPAGPLRESLGGGLARADAVVPVGSGDEAGGEASAIFGDRPVLPAVLAPVAGERFSGMRLSAFAGIGRPEKFFATLRRLGAELIHWRGTKMNGDVVLPQAVSEPGTVTS